MTTYDTLQDALSIIHKDVEKIKKLSEDDKTLDRTEATKLTDYIKTLIAVHKEEREQLKSDSLTTKSDDDIEELAKQALEYLNQSQQPEQGPAPIEDKDPKNQEETDEQDTSSSPGSAT